MSLDNLFHWSAQIALVACAGALVMRLTRIDVPAARHAFWRILLLAGLALPIVQPWSPPDVVPDIAATGVVVATAPVPVVTSVPAAAAPQAGRIARGLADRWLVWIGFVLAAGVAARFAWLGAGILRLRRLCTSGAAVTAGSEYEDLIDRIRARAEVRRVPRIGQPVTFGLFRPVVLVPDWFATLDPALRRVVLAHELWHVRRRDWGWVLVEESIRALFWFNPAVSWIVSRVQATREEVVDELTVQCTSTRKAYLEALLVFADQPTLFPATPFARRRHLFQRMVLISREAMMSSRRLVSSFAAASVMVVATGWYGVLAFPLTEPAASTSTPPATERATAEPPRPSSTRFVQGQAQPRDRRPGEPAPETAREREIKAAIQADRSNRELYFQLADLQSIRGAGHEAHATLSALRQASAADPVALNRIAQVYNRMGRFDETVSVLQQVAALDPANPQPYQVLAAFYWEKAFKDAALTPEKRLDYIRAGLGATDKALAVNPDYVDALVYKNILLRMEANIDTANRDALLSQAELLRNRAMDLQRSRGVAGGVAGGVSGGVAGGVPGGVAPPPPPPPPPPVEGAAIAPAPTQDLVDGQSPVRIGGGIKPPRKITHVDAVYPPIAQASRVQGVIIVEAVIDAQGNVVNTKVLRGQPLLDQAAVQAVSQWRFEPTLLNNVPTPVIMTVTVNFVLQD